MSRRRRRSGRGVGPDVRIEVETNSKLFQHFLDSANGRGAAFDAVYGVHEELRGVRKRKRIERAWSGRKMEDGNEEEERAGKEVLDVERNDKGNKGHFTRPTVQIPSQRQEFLEKTWKG